MNELVTIEEKNIPEVFTTGGLDPIVQKIRDEVTSTVPDITTPKGRKECASLAHKVARSKTYLDSLGKTLVSEIKARATVIDKERKNMRDSLDSLKDEVRAPLTEWEDAEKQRVDCIKEKIRYIEVQNEAEFVTSSEISSALSIVESVVIDDSFGEFAADAAIVKDKTATMLKAKMVNLEAEEKKAADSARIAAEQEEKERKEREERIAREAAEKAILEAQAEIEAAKQRELDMQREIEEAKSREIAAKAYAKREAEEAANQAEREKLEAVEAERLRLEKEVAHQEEQKERQRLLAEADERKRQEDKEHRRQINNEILADLASYIPDEDTAKSVIGAIASGYISHLKIEY